MDENRDRSTAPWHFINVELGLSFEDFTAQVAVKESVYTDRVAALKYVVHVVGDIRQPMHVSRAEDKGGNTIQLR